VAIHLKLYPAVLLLPLLANGAWRAALWTAAAALGVVGLQTAFFTDFTPWHQFAEFMARTYPGEFAFRNASFHSLAVNVSRFVLGIPPRDVLGEVRLASTLFSLAMAGWLVLRVAARRRQPPAETRLLEDGVDALAFSLLISQSVWEHHYVLALPLLIRAVAIHGRDRTLWIALAGFLTFGMPTFDLFPFSYHRAVGLLMLLRITRPRPAPSPPSRDAPPEPA
jgi:hypothetical protein